MLVGWKLKIKGTQAYLEPNNDGMFVLIKLQMIKNIDLQKLSAFKSNPYKSAPPRKFIPSQSIQKNNKIEIVSEFEGSAVCIINNS